MQTIESSQQNEVRSKTQSTPKVRAALRWLPLLASLTLAACASVGTGTPQAQVTQRATERWQALVARNFDKAYGYTAPGFKAVVTPDAYRGRFNAAVVWLDAEAVSVDCPEATKCLAKVRIDFKPLLGGRPGDKLSTYADETWLLEAGQWWVFESIKPR